MSLISSIKSNIAYDLKQIFLNYISIRKSLIVLLFSLATFFVLNFALTYIRTKLAVMLDGSNFLGLSNNETFFTLYRRLFFIFPTLVHISVMTFVMVLSINKEILSYKNTVIKILFSIPLIFLLAIILTALYEPMIYLNNFLLTIFRDYFSVHYYLKFLPNLLLVFNVIYFANMYMHSKGFIRTFKDTFFTINIRNSILIVLLIFLWTVDPNIHQFNSNMSNKLVFGFLKMNDMTSIGYIYHSLIGNNIIRGIFNVIWFNVIVSVAVHIISTKQKSLDQ